MYEIGEKIIYGENGVCTVEKIAPLEAGDGKLYYYLTPLIGSGTYFTPVDSKAFMRPVMSREAAEAFIDSIPHIQPAVCTDNRFNPPVGRFPKIEEDEAPYRLLCNEYPKAK